MARCAAKGEKIKADHMENIKRRGDEVIQHHDLSIPISAKRFKDMGKYGCLFPVGYGGGHRLRVRSKAQVAERSILINA